MFTFTIVKRTFFIIFTTTYSNQDDKSEFERQAVVLKEWYDEYTNLDLFQGDIRFISDDDEDMIEIRYYDGMLIDVGYMKESPSAYYITVVSTDDAKGWEAPLEEIKVIIKGELFDKIQETIYKYRNRLQYNL